jgi:hypothetical protein
MNKCTYLPQTPRFPLCLLCCLWATPPPTPHTPAALATPTQHKWILERQIDIRERCLILTNLDTHPETSPLFLFKVVPTCTLKSRQSVAMPPLARRSNRLKHTCTPTHIYRRKWEAIFMQPYYILYMSIRLKHTLTHTYIYRRKWGGIFMQPYYI